MIGASFYSGLCWIVFVEFGFAGSGYFLRHFLQFLAMSVSDSSMGILFVNGGRD